MSDNVQHWINKAQQGLAALKIDEVRASGILPESGNKYFPVVGYPPLTMFGDMDEKPLFENLNARAPIPTIAYLHIPFCPTRCTFCHWITKTKSKDEEVSRYIDYLDREMVLYKNKLGVDKIPATSVLWGGGTPTYPKPAELERLLKSFTTHYDLSACTQFSVEAEPTTLLGPDGMERLQIMKDYGVNRISLGVQSFDNDVLRYMGRAHDHEQTLQSIENMRKVGFDNIFIDLIYGFPGQTVENWADNMLQAAALGIEGWQLYRLRIKQHGDRPGEIIRQFQKNPSKFHRAEEIQIMKYLGIMISEEHGYGEHQRRIFAKSPDLISHYLRDWCCRLYDVAGVGVSSWSNLRGVFAQNIGDENLENYYRYIDEGKISVNRGKVRTEDDEARRSFIVPLKNMYVSKRGFKERIGKDCKELFGAEIDFMKQLGMIEEDDRRIWMTKRGSFFADEVATQFFNPDYLPFPDILQTPSRKVG